MPAYSERHCRRTFASLEPASLFLSEHNERTPVTLYTTPLTVLISLMLFALIDLRQVIGTKNELLDPSLEASPTAKNINPFIRSV
jgi:hypothetical protein